MWAYSYTSAKRPVGPPLELLALQTSCGLDGVVESERTNTGGVGEGVDPESKARDTGKDTDVGVLWADRHGRTAGEDEVKGYRRVGGRCLKGVRTSEM